MALVVPPPPVEALRRSPRISHRPRLPTPVSSRNGIPASLVQVSTVLVKASTLRTPLRRESYKPRSRVSVPSSRHRAKSLSAAAVPVRAGTKRKRLPATSDERDLPRYKLVVAEAHSDEEEQTPRQLRYAKRQRLLISQPGIDVPDAATEKISPLSCVHRGQENRPYPAPTEVYPVATARRPEPVPADPELEASYEDPHGPVFTPLCRQPIYRRHRTADSTDPTLWKVVCQERVEHLKHVYRDMFRAVVHAEAAAADAKTAAAATPAPVFSAEQLPGTAATAHESRHTQFELYAPSQYVSVDADGDTCMETESSSEDDDEDDEDSDDEDMEQDVVEVAYERVLILDTPASPISTPPRLPRLSSIRVSSLEPYPPSARDGVSFIGRGTPADPQRLADWGTPVRSRALSSPPWTPEPLFFTPDMVPQMTTTVNASTMQPDFSMDAAGLGMSWLDPSLHAESMSPSPSPTPTSYQPSMSSYDDSTNPVSFGFAGVTVPHPVFSDDPISHNPPLGATGCAVHESFLECLRGSGCSGPGLGAPSVFAAPSPSLESVMPDVELTPVLAAAPPPFPNPVLTQWVRSCIPSGSVTLGHALG